MKKREQRKPTFAEALLPLVAMLIILTVGYGILGFPKEAMLVMSAAFTAMVAFHLGVTWDDMIEGVSEKIAKAMPTILILLAVGIIVSSWMLSGTIPMMIYYGIQIVNPKFFYVTSFIICAVISTCTGTSWGSMGTIGVVLVIIAQGLGLSLPITAGAVVGGSYFGDKMSPCRTPPTWRLWQQALPCMNTSSTCSTQRSRPPSEPSYCIRCWGLTPARPDWPTLKKWI